jgi:hypothetical protein
MFRLKACSTRRREAAGISRQAGDSNNLPQ